MRPALRVWAGMAALALAAACGGSSTPTSPGQTQAPGSTPPPGGPAPNPGSHFVSGSVLSVLGDSAAGSVSFTVNGTLVGRSDTDGSFAVGFHAADVNRTVLTANGFVTRETGIRAPGDTLRLSLIPSAFDLTSFDEMVRPLGSGLTRWTRPPAIVLERRVVAFTVGCGQSFQAIDETITDADSDALLQDMRDGYDMLTAGRIGPLTSVTTQLSAAGSTVVPRQDRTIVVMSGAGLKSATGYWGSACWSRTAAGDVTSGFIMLDNGAGWFRRSVRMHELGHTLGYHHVTGRPSVMNPSASRLPTEFDRQAARIAVLRPIGNRSPDIDPFAHAATSLAASRAVTCHGAH